VAISKSKEWIGRSISWEKFKVNYFTGTVKLIDFKLYELDDSSIFVSFDTLILDAEPYQMLRDEIVVEQLYLSGLNLHVVMYDTAFNFDDLLHLALDTIPTNESEVAAEPLRFQLSNLELTKALITIKDVSIDERMELSNFDFFIPYVGWNQEDKSQAGLKFNFKKGGYFQSAINVNPNKGDFEALIKLKQLDLSSYHEFVLKHLDIGFFKGLTDVEVNLAGNINRLEETLASASMQLYNFELQDSKDKLIVAIKQLNLKVSEADQSRNRIIIDTLSLNEPYLLFEMYDSTYNLVEMINRAIPTTDSLASISVETGHMDTAMGPLYYALNSFLIKDGIVDIVDNRTGDPFTYHLSQINLHTDSVTS
jgi:hypothetical protein